MPPTAIPTATNLSSAVRQLNEVGSRRHIFAGRFVSPCERVELQRKENAMTKQYAAERARRRDDP